MSCDVILIRLERTDAAKLEDTFAAVQHGEFINGRQFLAKFLIIQTVGNFTPARFTGVECINSFLAKCGRKFLEGGRFGTAEEQSCITVADNGVSIIFVDRENL